MSNVPVFRSVLVDLKVDEKSDWDEVWDTIKDKSVCSSLSEQKAESVFK